ncbi:Leucine-rich repeat and IQ domain-containing protein 3 [Tupaia chinensis]|uniref:Leucine-rich repeat and IQ domain-containing protein 3 n=1 Tax=Tupaia chinensis TaxID=246437 RepID=L9KZX3_TUPCH|nr:Leucine-rich repeat and IQ domain-containing protein 3 [Tupaia chinensis]
MSNSSLLYNVDQKKTEDEEEELDTSFRLSVSKLPLHTSDSSMYATVLKEKRQDYFPAHAQPFSTTHQNPVTKKDSLMERNIKREFFMTHRAGMKLQKLNEIDKYYTEQKKQECYKEKMTAVTMAQIARERVSLTLHEYLNNKKYTAQKLIEKDNEAIQNGLRQLWKDKFNYLEKVRARRSLFLKEKKQKAADHELVRNLNNERTLLMKGMIKIDRLKNDEAVQKKKQLIVQEKLTTEKRQKDLFKQWKDFRAEEIYNRHCEEKFVIDMISFQKACERLQDVKTSVAIVKTSVGFKVPNGRTK